MQQLLNLFIQLENKIPAYQKSSTKVSAVNVAWHIHHTTLVTVKIIDALKHSNPLAYKWKFNWRRSFVYFINNIPRGRGKAPKSVLPPEDITIEMLYSGIEKARERTIELALLQRNHFFSHPYFGDLKLKEAIQFLQLHTKHHLKIIDDILKSELH